MTRVANFFNVTSPRFWAVKLLREKFVRYLLFPPGILRFLKDILKVMKLSKHLPKNRATVNVRATSESMDNKLRSEKKSN